MLSRRGFLGWGTGILSLLTLAGTGRMVQAFLAAGRPAPRPARFAVGRPEEFAVGSVTRRERVFVVRDARGLYALRGECAHLGCAYRWNPAAGEFECPCHGSRFDRAGRHLAGPARKDLAHVRLEVNRSGVLVADLREIVDPAERLVPARAGT